MVQVGQKIRDIRVAKRLTQEQIEHKTGIKREYLSKIETGGLPNITIKTLKKITDALGIPLRRFFRETNN